MFLKNAVKMEPVEVWLAVSAKCNCLFLLGFLFLLIISIFEQSVNILENFVLVLQLLFFDIVLWDVDVPAN